MALDLRPLSLGELLDRSFTLYRRHFRLFVGLMAIPSVFTLIFTLASELMQGMVRTNPDALASMDPAKMFGVFMAGGIVFFVVLVGYLVAYMVTLGATTVAVSELYAGRVSTIAGAYARMRGQVGRLMLLFVLIALRMIGLFAGGMVLVGFVAFGAALAFGNVVGPAIAALGMVLGVFAMFLACGVFSLRYAISVPSLVLENITASQAIRRSVVLTRGNLGRASVLVIFAIIITYAALFFLQGPFAIGVVMAGPGTSTAVWLSLIGAVAGTIGGAITGPVMIIALAVFYYDIRIRKEGLDLELMIANLDHQMAAPAPAV